MPVLSNQLAYCSDSFKQWWCKVHVKILLGPLKGTKPSGMKSNGSILGCCILVMQRLILTMTKENVLFTLREGDGQGMQGAGSRKTCAIILGTRAQREGPTPFSMTLWVCVGGGGGGMGGERSGKERGRASWVMEEGRPVHMHQWDVLSKKLMTKNYWNGSYLFHSYSNGSPVSTHPSPLYLLWPKPFLSHMIGIGGHQDLHLLCYIFQKRSHKP